MSLIAAESVNSGKVLSKGKMSPSYCTKILKFFTFNSASGDEDKFDPREKLEIFWNKGKCLAE